MMIPKEVFRAYDIRGIVGETLTEDFVFNLGRAIGTKIRQLKENSVVVGQDGRLSSPDMFHALSRGLLATGVNVVDLGCVPTPVLYFASFDGAIPSSVMITGSHNPKEYNGFKIALGGQAIYGEQVQALRELMESQAFLSGHGNVFQQAIIDRYCSRVVSMNHLNPAQKKPLKIVVDAGNGITGLVAPSLYRQLGCEVIPLYCEVDGNFPNHHPDPGQHENLADLQQAVIEHSADCGLAFDGDGDRLGVVDNQGKIIVPDRLLMLLAKDLLTRRKGASVIYDIKSSKHLKRLITEAGGNPDMWKTGHSLIKARMKETGALLAGEMSGHVFFAEDWYGVDDGLLAGVKLLCLLAQSENQTLSELFTSIPESLGTPEVLLPIAENIKFEVMDKLIKQLHTVDAEVTTLDGIRLDFEDGWGLIRASNTSANLVARFEADNEKALSRIKQLFKDALDKVSPEFTNILVD